MAVSTRNAQWTAGAGDRIIGTASDGTGSGVTSVAITILRVSTGLYWNGSSFSSVSPVSFAATNTGTAFSTWSLPFPTVNFPADGAYTITSTATDAVGNIQSPPASNTFRIENPSATITGKVVDDVDGDGVDDAEPGLAGATVTLYRDTNANGAYDGGIDLQQGSAQVTTSSGLFSFGPVVADTYFIIETNPPGYVSTAAIAGSNGASVVTSDRIKVTIPALTTSSGNEFLDHGRANVDEYDQARHQ